MAPTRRPLPWAKNKIPLGQGVPIALSEPLPTVNSKVTSRIPTSVQILLVTIISFSTSYVLFQTLPALTGNELGTVSRHAETTSDVALPLALKFVELTVGWLAGFDGIFMSMVLDRK
jgi:hypothetical protein